MSRSLLIISAAMAGAIASAAEQCVPLNLHTQAELTAEFAGAVAEQPGGADQSEAIAALSAKVDELTAKLIAAGVFPAPAPTPAEQPAG